MSFIGDAIGGITDLLGGASSSHQIGKLQDELADLSDPLREHQQGLGDFLNQLLTGGATKNTYGALSGTGSKLAELISNPDSVTQTKQFQSALGQGLGSANQALSAQGLTGSGAQLLGLQNVGMGQANQAYNTQLQQLSGLYGQELGALGQQTSQLSGNVFAGGSGAAQAIASLFGDKQAAQSQSGGGLGDLIGLGMAFL